MASLDELTKDLEELRLLHSQSTRPRVQDMLLVDIRKIESMISLQKQTLSEASPAQAPVKTKTEPQTYKEQIKKYAWDQSDKFMKLYITLNGVQNLGKESITSEFSQQSVRLVVRGLNNRDYELYIARLCEQIIPAESYHKIKSDCVLLMMRKNTSATWAYVTEAEKKAKETKKPKMEDNEDPNASIMKLMQNMYEEGDDEMKRTIAKAWTEGRDKKERDF